MNVTRGLTTGLPGLDEALKGVLAGDNIVWQIDAVADYKAFVDPYVRAAVHHGHKLVYFRFASHPPLVDDPGAEVHEIRPTDGFENFIASIHAVIEKSGRGAHYVFDCLSDLAAVWYSDQMLANFFMLTCPYLYDLETVTYFALFRNYHSHSATDPIANTTQLLLEAYRHKGDLYVRPIKVMYRYSPTMNMLHVWKGDEFTPVTASFLISEILSHIEWSGLHADARPGFWQRAFVEAGEAIEEVRLGRRPPEALREAFQRLVPMVISRDEEGMQHLVAKYLTLEDVLEVRRRMIGSGLIGGKTVGMLVARAILLQTDPRYRTLLEEHDSFYIGSDVFYTFLVTNGVWWVRQKQRNPNTFMEGAEQARQRILTGSFPAHIVRQLEDMLDYFGQSPFIVRSSSLLEDNYGNSFAGKYDSVFCANQGPRQRRIEDLLAAIRTIYASTMSEKALSYRARRGMLDRDEQMALLVMRVSGSMHGHYFFPPMAGVGFSFNSYAWSDQIDPRAGVVRLVFGLGTRAVDRSDDDYTRLVALNAPDRRPEHSFDEVRQYAQRRVDYLDLEANRLRSGYFVDIAPCCSDLPMSLFTSVDRSAPPNRDGSRPRGVANTVLTFDRLLAGTDFVAVMRGMMATLEAAYHYPVDTEFAVNFLDEDSYRINLLQCRPLQAREGQAVRMPQVDPASPDRIIQARSAVIGQSRVVNVDYLIYIVPAVYGQLPDRERYEVAHAIGEVNRALKSLGEPQIMLLGPGRWGTSTPSLGIPVSFPDINAVSILCEIVTMREDLIPDVSLGTHFLNELVEMDMLYLALFPRQGDNYLNAEFFENAPNRLLNLAPAAGKWAHVVRVIRASEVAPAGAAVTVAADAMEQRVVCYLNREAAAGPA